MILMHTAGSPLNERVIFLDKIWLTFYFLLLTIAVLHFESYFDVEISYTVGVEEAR
jgi:hypothetical protein